MGIRGLFKYLDGSLESELELEELKPETTLVIDASGWMLSLIINMEKNGSSRRELGGSYDSFSGFLCKELEKLQNQYRLQLVVVVDGSDTKMKGETIKKRNLAREGYWINLYDSCEDRKPRKQDELPLPPLYFQQFYAVLEQYNIKIIKCDVEAGQEIAKYCQRMNSESSRSQYFCYGDDSDYLLMKDCPYIKFGTIIQKPDTTVYAKVWRREITSQHLNLTVTKFVELAILLGNDYTAKYERKNFLLEETTSESSIVVPTGYSRKEMQEIVDWLITQDDNFKLTATDPQQLIAIQFSRKLYELEDLSSFDSDEKDSGEYAMNITQVQKQAIQDWMDEILLLVEPSTTVSVSRLAMTYFRCLEAENSNLFLLSFNYIEDLVTMINTISQHTSTRNDGSARNGYLTTNEEKKIMKKHIPSWEEVSFAHYYQLICKYISSSFPEQYLESTSKESRYMYDGELFHYIIYQRMKSLSAVPVLPPSLPSKLTTTVSVTSSAATPTSKATPTASSSSSSLTLPIDAYKEEILYRIGRDRVTIIHGETGCGKSSRLPAILLENAELTNQNCRMMVSQPRRIAASSLMKRLRTTLGDKVGLRMGHGIKDENDQTKIYFVTTGYLVRLLAHRPQSFHRHTHLIIDEVHERSVDGDLLCLLARKLLYDHPTIRLILMSATIHTSLYKTYFTNTVQSYGDMETLSVGVRRFPLDIKYVEDLLSSDLPQPLKVIATRIQAITKTTAGSWESIVPKPLVKEQYALAVGLIRRYAVPGTGVLVFVSGMIDIADMTERFEGASAFKVFAIHSDIPFEEQEAAFEPAGPNEVKVILATNAAESSITLPDVDMVICLGTHKAMRYFSLTHCVQLVNTWISKASATQRAGRTGRVRPGKVYRLYSRELEKKFDEHEQSEVKRCPLQDVILRLRVMLEDSHSFEGVVPVLMNLLEPPELENITKSFEFLYLSNMLSEASDEGSLTHLGKLAGVLPIDLKFTSLIAYGIALGIKDEVIILAAALSLPKPPFRMVSPLIFSDPDEYNYLCQKVLLGQIEMDAGIYSQPIMLLRMLLQWRSFSSSHQSSEQSKKYEWANKHGIVYSAMKQFDSTAIHLSDRVNESLDRLQMPDDRQFRGGGSKTDQNVFNNSYKSYHDRQINIQFPNNETVTLLRLLLTWTADGKILRMKPAKENTTITRHKVDITMATVTQEHLSPLFPSTVKWELKSAGRRIYTTTLPVRIRQLQVEEILHQLCLLTIDKGTMKIPVLWIECKQSKTKSKESKKDRKNRKQSKNKKKQTDNDDMDDDEDDDDDSHNNNNQTTTNTITNEEESTQDSLLDNLMLFAVIEEQKDVFLATLHNIFTRDKIINCSKCIYNHQRYHVLLHPSPSKKEMKRVHELHDTLTSSLALRITPDPVVTLTASHCQLQEDQLQSLFSENPSNSECNQSLKVSVQILHHKQHIQFYSDNDDDDDNNNSNNKETKGKDKKSKKTNLHQNKTSSSNPQSNAPNTTTSTYSNRKNSNNNNNSSINDSDDGLEGSSNSNSNMNDKSRLIHPLFTDLPVGMRLLNTYQLGYFKDKCMRLWVIPDERNSLRIHNEYGKPKYNSNGNNSNISNHNQSTQNRIVPGSKEWGQQKASSQVSSKTNANANAEAAETEENEKLSVKMSVLSPQWENLATVNATLDNSNSMVQCPKAFLPSMSVQAVAVPEGNRPLYGICQNLMIIGDEGKMVRCSEVSLLPPGTAFLSLALKCIGKDNSRIFSTSTKMTRHSTSSNNDLNEYQLQLAAEIAEIIDDVCMSPISYHDELRQRVIQLFQPWIDGSYYLTTSESESSWGNFNNGNNNNNNQKSNSMTGGPKSSSSSSSVSYFMNSNPKHLGLNTIEAWEEEYNAEEFLADEEEKIMFKIGSKVSFHPSSRRSSSTTTTTTTPSNSTNNGNYISEQSKYENKISNDTIIKKEDSKGKRKGKGAHISNEELSDMFSRIQFENTLPGEIEEEDDEDDEDDFFVDFLENVNIKAISRYSGPASTIVSNNIPSSKKKKSTTNKNKKEEKKDDKAMSVNSMKKNIPTQTSTVTTTTTHTSVRQGAPQQPPSTTTAGTPKAVHPSPLPTTTTTTTTTTNTNSSSSSSSVIAPSPAYECLGCQALFTSRTSCFAHMKDTGHLLSKNNSHVEDKDLEGVKKPITEKDLKPVMVIRREDGSFIRAKQLNVKKTAAKRYACPECLKVCDTPAGLQDHMNAKGHQG